MAVLFRWLMRIAGALVVLVALALVAVYWFASRSLPDYDGELSVAGISAPVEIVRDNANVPHIFGEADTDVFFGLGYAHAQDRLWQMTILRRTAQGRLSELFGTATVGVDSYLRRLDIYRLSQSSVAVQDEYTTAALEAYARGVNARLDQINAEALGRGAPEMFLFNAPLAPWVPADSLAIIKLMGLQLSSHLEEEVLRARVSLALDDEARLADILPDHPGPGVVVLPEYFQRSGVPRDEAPESRSPRGGSPHLPEALRPAPPRAHAGIPGAADGGRSDAAAAVAAKQGTSEPGSFAALFPALLDGPLSAPATTAPHPLSPMPPREQAGASNAWAAAPNRSASGGTLLANDPHLGFSAPAIWYLARLELETGGVIGGTIPGLPVILTGRSARLGWGLTTANVDDQDVNIERLNPDNAEEYLTPRGYVPFETRNSIVTVKDAEPRTLKLRWTRNGPVLPPSQFSLGTITPPGHVASLSWTLLDGEDTSLSAAMGLMRAPDIAGAIAAGEAFVAPAQNLTMVDLETIALKTIGHVPRRDAQHQSKGRIPAPGWLPENTWDGRMPYLSNPEFVAPRSGLLGNTNNKTVERPFPNHISFEWGDAQRVRRWQNLMQSREVHTRDSFIEAQLDTVSYTARSLLPLIGADLWFTGEAAPDGTPERARQRALSLLANWNGEMNEHLPEPLIYAAWLRALQTRLIQDELGPLAQEFTHVEPLFIERVFRDIDGASVWCDVKQSAPVETCTETSRQALDDALIWVEENWGNSFETLRWGDAHQATHDHQVLGDIPVLRYLVNIRQSTSGGDNTLMRGRTKGTDPDPFHNVHGAGYRGVYDFADPDSSVFIISTGQSGHLLSRHYDDLAQLWRRGEYIPMSLDPDLARAASVGVTRLRPRQDGAS